MNLKKRPYNFISSSSELELSMPIELESSTSIDFNLPTSTELQPTIITNHSLNTLAQAHCTKCNKVFGEKERTYLISKSFRVERNAACKFCSTCSNSFFTMSKYTAEQHPNF